MGLSPRRRGNRPCARAASSASGSIPAQAGEPSTRALGAKMWRVYPRAGGGTLYPPLLLICPMGLSPRRRGNLGRHIAPDQRLGSIPAQAGEPCRGRRGPRRLGVYPRAGGGTRAIATLAIHMPGLSPRRRGNQVRPIFKSAVAGSIPAQAGEPSTWTSTLAAARVYPRAGGGTPRRYTPVKCPTGLSPRRRGNHFQTRTFVVPHGSIPAQAGEPCRHPLDFRELWVYPRAGGGTRFRGVSTHLHWGLSPRRRGNREGRYSLRVDDGSIPAQAGEPRPSPKASRH